MIMIFSMKLKSISINESYSITNISMYLSIIAKGFSNLLNQSLNEFYQISFKL